MFTLIIDKTGEKLLLQDRQREVKPLFITSTFLKGFHSLLCNKPLTPFPGQEKVVLTLEGFYRRITGDKAILDMPVPFDKIQKKQAPPPYITPEFHAAVMYVLEVDQLRQAVQFWLCPDKYKRGYLREKLFETPISDFAGALYYRCLEFTSAPLFAKGKLTRQHTSAGIIPLAWAEVWYYLEHDLPVGLCPYCWDIYTFKNLNCRQFSCGKKKCKRDHLVASKGGPEGYRVWETTRKMQVKPGRKPGRPKGT